MKIKNLLKNIMKYVFHLKLGNDIFGKNYLQNLEENNIKTDHVTFTDQASTGVAPILVDDNGSH